MNYPTLEQIDQAARSLTGKILLTPTWIWPAESAALRFGANLEVFVKLECLQHTGSFKARAALLAVLSMSAEQRAAGVITVSAGNHAAATAFAARAVAAHAKVVMPRSANPFRVDLCQRLGAEVLLVDDVHQAFDTASRIQQDEGRLFIHPFEGQRVALGTGTLGAEFYRQAGDLDAVVIPIGGGGLCAGMACAIKQINPDCQVIGVEPTGADTMHRSFAAGSPQAIDRVTTIADSLGAPHAADYSFSLCRQFVDELVLIDDQAMCQAMNWLLSDLKLAVEPAGAAAAAALAGPLAGRLEGRVGLIACGANIDSQSFVNYIQQGMAPGNQDRKNET